MKKSLALLLFVILGCLSVIGCSGKGMEANKSINEIIAEQAGEEYISFDDCDFSWEYVIIDSFYHAKAALEELGVSNREEIPAIPYDDAVFVIFFLENNSIVEYTTALLPGASVLKGFVFQDTKQSYPYGTVFEKES